MSNTVMETNQKIQFKREIGLGAAIALSVGSAIGSGIFTAPQSLAAASDPKYGLIGWVISSIGAVLIALCFANLATKFPDTGGIVVYTKKAFGDFAGFIVAWIYWIGNWTGAAAIITACIRYLSNIFPIFNTNRAAAFIGSSVVLWFLIIAGIKGTKESSFIQVITTLLKLIPMLVFIAIGFAHFNPSFMNTVSPEVAKNGGGGIGTLGAALAITAWAFTGFEASTTTAGEVKDPEKNLRKSIMYGTIIVAALYVLVSFVAMGVMPQSELSNSTAPLAEMINKMTGVAWGGMFISVGVVISTFGSANGSILMATRAAQAAADDKMFPDIFKKMSAKYHTPYTSLIICGVLANILLILNYIQSLNSAFNFIMLLATLTLLPPYAIGAAAEIVEMRKNSATNVFTFIAKCFMPLITFLYVVYAVYGTGASAVMWGFILILLGIPFYVYVKLKAN